MQAFINGAAMMLLALGLIGTTTGESSHGATSKYTPLLFDELVDVMAQHEVVLYLLAFPILMHPGLRQ